MLLRREGLHGDCQRAGQSLVCARLAGNLLYPIGLDGWKY